MGFLLLHLLLCHYYCNSYVNSHCVMPNSVMSAPLSDAVEPDLLGIAKELRNAWHTPRSLWIHEAEFDVS